jgi:CheY-like chemotaxis protein
MDGSMEIRQPNLLCEHPQAYQNLSEVIPCGLFMVDGQEALKHIRGLEKQLGIRGCREVKIVMLTALDDPRSVSEALYRGGATSSLVKPVDLDRLLGELRLMSLVTTAQVVNIAYKEHGADARKDSGLDYR